MYVAENVTNVMDGGDNVLRLILTYMIFLRSSGNMNAFNHVDRNLNIIHNIGVILIYMQLLVLYTTSSTLKLQGEEWINGTAVYYVLQMQWFRPKYLAFIQDWVKNPFIVTSLTYMGLLYQLWYPVALFSRFHILWTVFGVLFHFGIAIFLGLVTFSSIMIGLILFAINDEKYERMYKNFLLPTFNNLKNVYEKGKVSYAKFKTE